ncbi:MAG: putative Na+/H+ antiporter [Pelomonas sp.]|nr:putative Na+/H+ antiporter [Roseateles sp.]
MTPTPTDLAAAALFALALLHTFAAPRLERLARRQPRHAGLWHLLGEVEVVFGLWAGVLVVAIFALEGRAAATTYLDTRNYTEPLFVFAIMVIAATRPVLQFAGAAADALARRLPLPRGTALYFVLLVGVPLLGSFITEPAAMTLAALMLRESVFARPTSARLRYATLGVLFVNISIGGTLTPFAAPPVLMVADAWGWDTRFMLAELGGRAALAVLVNGLGAALLFRRELGIAASQQQPVARERPRPTVLAVHLLALAGVVAFAHHPPMFLGILLGFLGFATAYPQHQDRLILREALLVAFFLGGLVVLGGLQQWWLEPALLALDAKAVFYGALALTAFTDNAALTYLGSLVPGLAEPFKLALVGGAVAGGGLTVVANAPNPAGVAILRDCFAEDGGIGALRLFAAALAPTLVAVALLRWL